MNLESIFLGATFDDFLLRPQCGVLNTRKGADLSMPLTTNLQIDLPIISANMHTVTGQEMAKGVALEGGCSFLPRHCPIKEQALMVRNVKRQHSFVIEKPLCIHANATIAEAVEITGEYGISGLLVEKKQGSGILVGVLSKRDIEYALGVNASHEKVSGFMSAISPALAVAHPTVSMAAAEKLMLERRVEKLPLIEQEDNQWHIKGLITLKDLRLAKQKPYSSKDSRGRLLVGATIGATGDFMERASELIGEEADCILMDIAHGHSEIMRKAVEDFRKKFGNIELVCGNAATFESAKFFSELGVNGIKIGVGPGKGCRTRLETSAGVPQLQAIREAYLAAGDGIPIIADGGVREDKDIALAILCGASTVMLGSMLAGTDEAPGVIIEDPRTKQKVKIYRGMTSPQAVFETTSRENLEEALETAAEGLSTEVPYIGPVLNVLGRIRGHLQSAVSYAGEETLKEARQKIAQDPSKYLIRLSEASKGESFER